MTYDLMHPGLEQFLYLNCPQKIRAAMIYAGGKPPPLDSIEAKLSDRRYVRGANIEDDYDEPEPVRKPAKPRKLSLTPQEKARLAAIAARIPDREAQKPTSMTYGHDLVRYVMKRQGILRGEFFAGTRVGHVRAAAAMIAVILRRRNPATYTYPAIARILGRRDHTTIMYAIDQWPRYAKMYPEYQALHDQIAAGLDTVASLQMRAA
jgi:hypothetical protein